MPTILVVDDEPGILMFIAKVLGQSGYCVLTATDGADATPASQSHQSEIALLITDGPDLGRALSADDPDLPILFMSSRYDPPVPEQFEGSVFLSKPFSVGTLLDAVRLMLPGVSLQSVN